MLQVTLIAEFHKRYADAFVQSRELYTTVYLQSIRTEDSKIYNSSFEENDTIEELEQLFKYWGKQHWKI